MALATLLSDEAIQLFKQRWGLRLSQAHRLQISQFDCPLHWLMPELLRLAQEFGDHDSLHDIRPLVRRLVEDLDTATQPALHGNDELAFESLIDTLVDVLDEVRDRARQRGQWIGHGADAAPIMCG